MPARRSLKPWTGHAEETPLAEQEPVTPGINRLRPEDQPFHSWYRFVLSFPAHLVSDCLSRLGARAGNDVLFDPFCGTGTTLVEAKRLGFSAFGMEALPVPALAARVKTDWDLSPKVLERTAIEVIGRAQEEYESSGLPGALPLFDQGNRPVSSWTPPREILDLIPRGMISPLPLRRVLILRDHIDRVRDVRIHAALRVALAASLVEEIGNVGFGPEIYTTRPKEDVPVCDVVLRKVRRMAQDLQNVAGASHPKTSVLQGDSRELAGVPEGIVDVVITSPPYPNEKDYTRTTRLETVLLGLVRDRAELRALKKTLLRSNSRGVYREDTDDVLARRFPRIVDIARRIEERRIALGKDSGFERMYPRVVLLYFSGMMRHFLEMRRVLRPGARLAYVVGDQMSYLMVPIPTGALLAEVARAAGYVVDGIDLWRTRISTTSGVHLREEVVLLRWPGHSGQEVGAGMTS